ncbi:VanZ family protein [Candidatus Aquicultor sp.]
MVNNEFQNEEKTTKLAHSTLHWLLVLAFLAVIAHFSSQTFHEQDLRPELKKYSSVVSAVRKLPEVRFAYNSRPTDNHKNPVDFIQFFIRKGAHVAIYGAFGLALAAALKCSGLKRKWPWLVAGALLISVASLDEWNQTLVGNRTGMARDVLLDFGGFLVFTCLAWVAGKTTALFGRPKTM